MSLQNTPIVQVLIVSSARPRQKKRSSSSAVAAPSQSSSYHDPSDHHTSDVYLRAFVSRMSCLRRHVQCRRFCCRLFGELDLCWVFGASVGKTVNGGNEALARIVFQSPVELQNHMNHFHSGWCWRGRTVTWTVWPVICRFFAQWW